MCVYEVTFAVRRQINNRGYRGVPFVFFEIKGGYYGCTVRHLGWFDRLSFDFLTCYV